MRYKKSTFPIEGWGDSNIFEGGLVSMLRRAPKMLPCPLRQRVNVAAHAIGLRNAEAARIETTMQVWQARASGAGFDQMLELLATLDLATLESAR
jgi:hypothetical protein